MAEIQVWIGNLGKYNEGELTGEWVKFPCEKSEFNDVLNRIGIGSPVDPNDSRYGIYEEYFAADYEDETGILYSMFGEYPNWEQLNLVAGAMSELDDNALQLLKNYIDEVDSSADPITVIANILENNIYIHPDVVSESDYGYYLVDLMGNIDDLGTETLNSYFDYESFGRDLGFDSYELDTTESEQAVYDLIENKEDIISNASTYTLALKDSGGNYIDYHGLSDNEDVVAYVLLNEDEEECYEFDVDLFDRVKITENILEAEDIDVDNLESILSYGLDSVANIEIDEYGHISLTIDTEDLTDIEFGDRDTKYVSAGEYFCGEENATPSEIAYAYVEDIGIENIPDVARYFDYESFGRDCLMDDEFATLTNYGLLEFPDFDDSLGLENLDLSSYSWDIEQSEHSLDTEAKDMSAAKDAQDTPVAGHDKDKGAL